MASAFKAQILLQLMEIYHAELTTHLYSLPNKRPDNFEDLNHKTYLLATAYDNFLNSRNYTLLTHLSSFSNARFTYLLDANHYSIQKMRQKFRSYELLTTEQLHAKIIMFQQRFITALNSFPRKHSAHFIPFITKTLSSINCFKQLITDHEDCPSLLPETPTSVLLTKTLTLFHKLLIKIKSYGPSNHIVPGELY